MIEWNWDYLLYACAVLVLIIITWFMLKGKKKGKICDHDFQPQGYINVKEKVRMIMVCKKCGQSMHSVVPTKRQLKDREDLFYERYFKE